MGLTPQLGAIFIDLNQAVKDHPELIKRYLMTEAVTPASDILAALHGAFWTSGSLLYVPKGVTVESPVFSLIGLAREGRVDLSHTLVVLEDGAQATLVRESSGQGVMRLRHSTSGAVWISWREANLRFVNIQNWDQADLAFQPGRALVEGDDLAPVDCRRPGLASGQPKSTRRSRMTGQGAASQVNGVMFTTGRQHLAYFTRQDHAAPHTTSDLLYKGGLTGPFTDRLERNDPGRKGGLQH